MFGTLDSFIGLVAAACTTASYFPQLRKAWESGSTDDLSLPMLVLLATGLTLWLVYGLIRSDTILVLANVASLLMLGALIYLKLRPRGAGGGSPPREATRQA